MEPLNFTSATILGAFAIIAYGIAYVQIKKGMQPSKKSTKLKIK